MSGNAGAGAGSRGKATIPCPSCARLNRVDLGRATDGARCGHCAARLAIDTTLTVRDATLDRILGDADVPVLVDFHADWCGPCKVMAPVLEEVARAHAGRAIILKLDTDRNPRAASRFGIRGIPTLILFRRTEEVSRQVGAVPRAAIEAMLGTA